MIRFLSAALTGFLRQIAGVSPKMLRYGSSLRALHPSSVEAAKTYVAGVLVSVFLSGVLFHYLAGLATGKHGYGYMAFVMALAGNSWLAPLLIVGVALSLEALLRLIFSFGSADQNHSWPHQQQHQGFAPLNHGANKGAETTMTLESAFPPSPSVSTNADHQTRNRIESATSVDDFYDCRSVHSDMDMSSHTVDLMGGSSNNNNKNNNNNNAVPKQQQTAPSASAIATEHRTEICQYKNRKCVYQDGSPSYVPQGDSIAIVPESYMEFYRNNAKAAKKAWEKSQSWRREKDVWRIHTLPNVWFPRIKQAYPHFLHGHSKAGYPIIYEQPGRMNLKELFRTGCKIHDMTFHYQFFMEYISNIVCTRGEIRALQGPNAPPPSCSSWGIMVVMDVKGAGLSHLSGDVVKYLKAAGDINSAHYPLSMKRAFLVNSPFWLAGAWSGIKGILPDSVQVDIRSETNYYDSLCKYIDPDQIPPEYGGSSPYSLGQHPYELGMAEFVKDACEQHEQNGGNETSAALHPQQETVPSVVNAPQSTTTIAAGTSDAFMADPLQSSSPLKSRDRSHKNQQRTSRNNMDQSSNSGVEERPRDFVGVLRTVSCLHFISSAVQGSLEVLVPLWMLSPPFVGGLGFSPYRSCLLLLSTFFALLFLIRRIQSESISRIVIHTPLRAFRLGVGAQSLMLTLLAVVASPSKSRESWPYMVVIFSIFVCTAFAVIFGHSSCMILHNLALNGIDLRQGYYGGIRRSGLEWHGRASLLCLIGEVLGAFIFIPIWSWSMSDENPTPFDAASSLLAVSLVCGFLYMGSFSLLVASSKQTQFTSFAQEAIVVGAADMVSLFGEPLEKANVPSSITSPDRDLTVEGATIEKIRKAI